MAAQFIGWGIPMNAATTASWPLPAGSLLGVYQGDYNIQNDDGASWLGGYPNIASSYWIKSKSNWNTAFNVQRMQRGISPLITLTVGNTGYLTGIVNGDATALAWLDDALGRLKTISETNPAIPVFFTLNHEYNVQVNNGNISGVDADTTGVLQGRGLDVVIQRAASLCPLVKVGCWFNAGHGNTTETGTLATMNQQPAWVGADYYSTGANTHPASETLATTWNNGFNWIKANADYARLGSAPLFAPEFGDCTNHGETSVANYFTNIRSTMRSVGIVAAVFFNRDSGDYPYKIDTGAVNGVMTSAETAFATSLTNN